MCRHGPCGNVSSLGPWDGWIPPDLHASTGRFLIPLEVLHGFIKHVVVNRRVVGVRKWTHWLREDLGSKPCAWLRPDFVPPSPFLVIKDPQTQSSRILVEPHLVDAEFRKAWMPFFCGSGQFGDFVGHEADLELPRISGRELHGLKSPLLAGWMDGHGMRLKLFLSLGSPG